MPREDSAHDRGRGGPEPDRGRRGPDPGGSGSGGRGGRNPQHHGEPQSRTTSRPPTPSYPPTATVTIKPAAKSRPISGRATAPGPARGPARDPGAPIVTGQGSARVILTPAPSRAVSAAGREIMYICIKYFEIRLVTSNFNDLVTFNECICFIIRS